MRPNKIRSLVLSLLLNLALSPAAQAKLEVHEWGTFTSLVGSNGITQDGMYHEDEPLPAFVHDFGETSPASVSNVANQPQPTPAPFPTPRPRPCTGKGCFDPFLLAQAPITQKMETPVLYFYTDKPQRVTVNVKFPEGVVTETYPAPIMTQPTRENIERIASGDTTFIVDVLGEMFGKLPYVSSDNIYSHARNVASNLVRSGREIEKFIFYRGLGRFQPRFRIQSRDGALKFSAGYTRPPRGMFLVHVDSSGHGQLIDLGSFGPTNVLEVPAETIERLRDHKTQHPREARIRTGRGARDILIKQLVGEGLKVDEATAMIDTWEHGYLKIPGLRLLYTLPRDEVDQVLPLTITPKPDNLERVFVGRIEILTDTEENSLVNRVLIQGDKLDVASLGRFAEPILRRLEQRYESDVIIGTRASGGKETKDLFARLIARASAMATSEQGSRATVN